VLMLGILTRRAMQSRAVGWEAGRLPFRPVLAWLGMLGLCAAYLQGGLDKLFGPAAAIAETAALHVPMPALATAATVVTELAGSLMVLAGWHRRLGALWLAAFTAVANMLANAWWSVPAGPLRTAMENGFFEHIGLIGGFVLIVIQGSSVRNR
jgi:uncharacterized membrane protein YphA (DoxX/SURF4 family)